MGPSNGAVYLEPRVHAAENTSNKGMEMVQFSTKQGVKHCKV
jgi:hypothetical protein